MKSRNSLDFIDTIRMRWTGSLWLNRKINVYCKKFTVTNIVYSFLFFRTNHNNNKTICSQFNSFSLAHLFISFENIINKSFCMIFSWVYGLRKREGKCLLPIELFVHTKRRWYCPSSKDWISDIISTIDMHIEIISTINTVIF